MAKTKTKKKTTEKTSKKPPTLQDILKKLDEQITKQFEKLEKTRGRRCYPFLTEIAPPVVDDVYEDLQANYGNCDGKLDVYVFSGGGDIDSAYNLSMLFRRYGNKELNFLVTRWGKSAATLLACSGNYIVMTQIAELGPLDPQITELNPLERRLEQFSPLHVASTLDMIRNEFENGSRHLANALMERLQFPLTLGRFLKCQDIGEQYLKKLLETKMLSDSKEQADGIARRLTKEYADHGFCINLDEAKDIGLVVVEPSKDELKIMWEIHKLRKQRQNAENTIRKEKMTDMIKQIPPGILDKLIELLPIQPSTKPNNNSGEEKC